MSAIAGVDHLVATELGGLEAATRRLARGFWRETGAPETRRSHFENGRYENIYPDLERLPEAKPVLAVIRAHAARLLGLSDPAVLSLKVWFNVMAPGDATLPHRHDIADERISGVYYLAVPPRSGDLVITTPEGRRVIQPRPGLLVTFPPHWEHEVTAHCGRGIRLAMAFNGGVGDAAGGRGRFRES